MKIEKLNSSQKIKTLSRVGNLFDRHFWHQVSKHLHNGFKAQYPYEYKNVGVDKLSGNALKLHESHNQKEISMVKVIWNQITDREARKEYIRGYKSPNKQRGGVGGWFKRIA